MNDVYQDLLSEALALHKEGKYSEAELLYNRLLNRTPFQEEITFLLADLYLRKEYNGLAVNLLSNLLQNNPKHDGAWCNLGVGFRKEGQIEFAKAAWKRALAITGDSVQVCSNMAGLYADHAEPEKALHWIDRALAVDPQNVEAHWLKSLSLLTLQQWDEGWKHYEWRQKLVTWDHRASIDAPMWDGKEVDRLYIHGEQGVGDEVMFASVLGRAKAKHITLEVNPKVAELMRQSFPGVEVVTEEISGKYDAKLPIGSLMKDGFNPEPYLRPDPWRVIACRKKLEALGPGPYVAVTWIGGTKATRAEDRSLTLSKLRPILDAYTCVSAQYFDHNPYIEPEREREGLAKLDDASTGQDLHDQAALFKAVDAVVTVQQTAVHVAGGVGAKTYALIGSHPHWRYGIEGDRLPFYKDVRLYRQKDSWDEAISRLKADLDSDLNQRLVQTAEQRAA